MTAITTGTLVDGVVTLDESVDVPNNSRVTVSIAPLLHEPAEAKAALSSFLKRAEDRPVHSGGTRSTRDELHERR